MLKDKIDREALENFLRKNNHQDEVFLRFEDKDGRYTYIMYNPFFRANSEISFEDTLKELVIDFYDNSKYSNIYLSTITDFFRIR
jgi:hypothetical protein